jgi:hypothetical protein
MFGCEAIIPCRYAEQLTQAITTSIPFFLDPLYNVVSYLALYVRQLVKLRKVY